MDDADEKLVNAYIAGADESDVVVVVDAALAGLVGVVSEDRSEDNELGRVKRLVFLVVTMPAYSAVRPSTSIELLDAFVLLVGRGGSPALIGPSMCSSLESKLALVAEPVLDASCVSIAGATV